MEKLTLEELKVLESMRKSLRELQKKDLEEVIDFSEELKKGLTSNLVTLL